MPSLCLNTIIITICLTIPFRDIPHGSNLRCFIDVYLIMFTSVKHQCAWMSRMGVSPNLNKLLISLQHGSLAYYHNKQVSSAQAWSDIFEHLVNLHVSGTINSLQPDSNTDFMCACGLFTLVWRAVRALIKMFCLACIAYIQGG